MLEFVEDRISVIIPTYQNATTLERCIRSVLNQESCDIEIIVIIDGGDMPSSVIEHFKDCSVLFKNIVHSGVSVARNVGLLSAQGEYVCFCDADDELLPDALNVSVANLKDKGADLVVSNVYKRNSPVILKNECLDRDSAIKRFFRSDSTRILGTVYGKLFKKELIGDLLFNKSINIGEDADFVLSYLLKSQCVYLIPEYTYRHHLNPSGIIYQATEYDLMTAIYASKEMINKIKHEAPEFLDDAINDLYNTKSKLYKYIDNPNWRSKIDRIVSEIIKDLDRQ